MQLVEILNLGLSLFGSVLGIFVSIRSLKESKSRSNSSLNIKTSYIYEVKYQNYNCGKAVDSGADAFVFLFFFATAFLGKTLSPYIQYFLLADIIAGLAIQVWIVRGGQIYLPGEKTYQYLLFSLTPLFIAVICPIAVEQVNAQILNGSPVFQSLGGIILWLITGLSVFAVLLLMLLELASVLILYMHGLIFKILFAFLKTWFLPLLFSVMIGLSAFALYSH